MANMLINMLKLQTDYRIPMRMDLSIKNLIEYYRELNDIYDTSERSLLIKNIIKDLEIRLQPVL